MLTLVVKPKWVHCDLDETSVVAVLVGTMSIQLSKDNHDSWVMRTTSVECKTVITAVLMVMSGMDPHMISGNPGDG
jgi:hypothetical protein